MTNRERADQLLADAWPVADEMRVAVARQRWNLALRRAQEVIELVSKALLNEMGVEYPRMHDPALGLAQTLRERQLAVDPGFLERLLPLSARLAAVRGPALDREIAMTEAEAREAVEEAERVVQFGTTLLTTLRGSG